MIEGVVEHASHLGGGDHVAVLAAQADGPPASGVDEAHDLLVDGARQHHLDDLDRGLVGDAQARREFGLDAELLQHGADLRPAAVDHDRVHPRLLQQDHVAGEAAGDLFIAHGVAAIFHHDDGFVIAQHMGQRLHEDFSLKLGAGLGSVGHGCFRRRGIARL